MSKQQARKKVKKTAGTNRGRPIAKKKRKRQYTPLKRVRPPKMTDAVVSALYYIFSIDGTKEEACVFAGISTQLYDYWYNGKYKILWEFNEVEFISGQMIPKKTIREALFSDIMNNAYSQPFIRARQSQAKNISKGKERTLETFLTTRDPRYKKKLDLEGGNFNIVFGGDVPNSPFIKEQKDVGSDE